jgi:cytosine/adenosine deaminase-related metal-dependent hydrolase
VKGAFLIGAALLVSACAAPRGLVLIGATLIDGSGAAPLKDAVVVIEGERIVAVGPQSHVRLPKGFRTVSARGQFIVPVDAPTDAASIEALRTRVKAGEDPLVAFTAEVRRRQEERQLGRGGPPRLLQPGAPADLLLIDGDPLADFARLARIHQRVQGGRLDTVH